MSRCLLLLLRRRRHDALATTAAAAAAALVGRAALHHGATWHVRRGFATSRAWRRLDEQSHGDNDPRLRELGREISDDYASIREHYATPKYPIVLAHGLLGFGELRLSNSLPPIQYWHGIKKALTANGATVLSPSVPPSSSIEDRAEHLAAGILAELSRTGTHPRSGDSGASTSSSSSSSPPATVNIVAHSMGGLDARYMISRLRHPGLRVAGLVTIATPHRGSAFADYVLEEGAGPLYLPKLYGVLRRAGLGTRAFAQLTRPYMAGEFNAATRDDPDTRYFSFGAAMAAPPRLLSPFRQSHRVIAEAEGPNDGLVSVESARWGEYRGTLVGVSHLDLINWSNRVRWAMGEWMGWKRPFNAVALYLDIVDMLAKEGL